MKEEIRSAVTTETVIWSINRDLLLDGLKTVAGVVESAQVLQILSYVHITIAENKMILVASDSEVELRACVSLASPVSGSWQLAVSCRKLLDVCRSLLADSTLEFSYFEGWLEVRSGKACFKLATLPAKDFPFMAKIAVDDGCSFELSAQQLKLAMHKTCFAMANQDVRFFLNGLHLEVKQGDLVATATDGHRLARCVLKGAVNDDISVICIVPRKAIFELLRLVKEVDSAVKVVISNRNIQFSTAEFVLTSTLLEGQYPACDRLLSVATNSQEATINCVEFKRVLSRAAILSHDKFKGVKLGFSDKKLGVAANNAEQEKSEDVMVIDYDGADIDLSFNINYLTDVLGVLGSDSLCLHLSSDSSSVLITDPVQNNDLSESVFLVMPLSL